MSTMQIDRGVVEQALEALQGIYIAPEHDYYINAWWPACRDAIPPLRAALAQPDARLIEQAPVLLQALQTLVSVCQRMDLEHHAERPSEAEYQAAVQAAQRAIQAVEGAI